MKITTFISAFLILVFLAHTSFADQSKETAAITAAESFLQLVDTGQYAKSWEVSSDFFRNQIPKQQWEKQLSSIRPAFGLVINRTIKAHSLTRSLPGAPDGEYVVIQFNTDFQNKKKAVETVTPMLESDGTWRVSGYFLK